MASQLRADLDEALHTQLPLQAKQFEHRRRRDVERRMLDELPKFDQPQPSFAERLTLPALLLLAWVVFELTANATLSVLAACLKFGWEDFHTAVWLRRVDPEPLRGRACSWFYAASGVWKTALMPIVLIALVSLGWALLSPAAMPANPAFADQVWSAIVVGLGASALLVLFVSLAAAYAVVANVRVWVHHDLHDSRRNCRWPPRWNQPTWQHDNRGRAILATALFFATIGLPPVLFHQVIRLGPRMEVVAMLTIVFGLPMASATIYAALRDRIFARQPCECWPESLPAELEG